MTSQASGRSLSIATSGIVGGRESCEGLQGLGGAGGIGPRRPGRFPHVGRARVRIPEEVTSKPQLQPSGGYPVAGNPG
jgi:hypothetical protein